MILIWLVVVQTTVHLGTNVFGPFESDDMRLCACGAEVKSQPENLSGGEITD
jgi:hypothetical protein